MRVKRIASLVCTILQTSSHTFKLNGVKMKHDDGTRSTRRGHIASLLTGIRRRAKNKNIPFDLDLEYLFILSPINCPVLNIPLSWCEKHQKQGPKNNSPSLDRIEPEKGYVKGNVMWMSQLANVMKNSATKEELKLFANWVLKQ